MCPGQDRPGLSVRRYSHPQHLHQSIDGLRESPTFEELSENDAIQAQVLKGLHLARTRPNNANHSPGTQTKLIQTPGYPEAANVGRNVTPVQIIYQNFRNITTEHSRSFYGINFPSTQGVLPEQLCEIRETISTAGEVQERHLHDVKKAQERHDVLLHQLQKSVSALQKECSDIALRTRNIDLDYFDAQMTIPQMPLLCMQMVHEAQMLRRESEENRKQAQDMLRAAHMTLNALSSFERASFTTRKQLQANGSEDPVHYILIKAVVTRSRRLWELETWKGYLREFDIQICTVVTLLSIQLGQLGPPPRPTTRATSSSAVVDWGCFRVSGTPQSFTMLLQLEANERNNWCGLREAVETSEKKNNTYSWKKIFRKKKSFRWTFIARTDASSNVSSNELVFHQPTACTDPKARQDFYALSASSFCAGLNEYVRGLVSPFFKPNAARGVSQLHVIQSGLVYEYDWNFLGISTVGLIILFDIIVMVGIMKWLSLDNIAFWCGVVCCFRIVMIVTSVLDILEAENSPYVVEQVSSVSTHQCTYGDGGCGGVKPLELTLSN